jgi:hypothetical protein
MWQDISFPNSTIMLWWTSRSIAAAVGRAEENGYTERFMRTNSGKKSRPSEAICSHNSAGKSWCYSFRLFDDFRKDTPDLLLLAKDRIYRKNDTPTEGL